MGSTDKTATANTNTNTNTNTNIQANKPTPTPKAEPMNVTTDELHSTLKTNALKASQTYKNKYVKLKGKLSNIDSGGKYFSLSDMNSDFSFKSVLCKIEKEHLEKVTNFKDKQLVTVVGTITDVGEVMGYSLDVETIE